MDALVAAVDQCRSKAAARMQLYRWLVFSLLVGNGDNHLKNISFLVDASGISPFRCCAKRPFDRLQWLLRITCLPWL